MTALALAVMAGYGVHLLWTARVHGWTGWGPGSRRPANRPRSAAGAARRWLIQAGLDGVSLTEFAAVTAVLAVVGGGGTYSVFGAAAPSVLAAGAAGCAPVASYRNRRRRRRELAQEAWPRMIEEIRILTGAVGRSIPQALFEAGQRGPVELHGAFDAAHREWLITTDFGRTVAILKDRLADPTADAACETLLVAHQVGGADLDRRLEALADDRTADLQGRKDARAQQAGVRFARRFVLVVPFGMAVAGMSVGSGRDAYREPQAQFIVLIGMTLVLACWVWAGRIMALPEEQRVFP
ncbi:MAG: hypothetical protein JWM47_1453 [Acidimicrobiales bacterium]|nr:hypothetical protein [Acidimicrobiales bacterium]